MAFDKSGKYHMNPAHARMMDGAPPKKMGKEGSSQEEATEPKAEAEAEGDVPEHLRDLHAKMGGKHMHVHYDGMMATSHHVGDDGNVEGPHHHQSPEELHAHLDRFFNEEEAEPEESMGHEQHALSGY